MEKRRSERIDVKIKVKVKISLDTKSFNGYIYNVSKEGLFLNVITASAEILTNLICGTRFELKLNTNKIKEITLPCEIRWTNIYSESNFGIVYNIGVEILELPAEYKEFLMTL